MDNDNFEILTKRYSECFHKDEEKIEKFNVIEFLEYMHDIMKNLIQKNSLCICFSQEICRCNKECFCMDYNFLEVKEIKMEMTSNCQFYIELITNSDISVPAKNKKTINIFELDDTTQNETMIIQVMKYVQQLFIHGDISTFKKKMLVFDIDTDNITFKNGKLCILFNYMNYYHEDE
jgi:hypothetical protein